MRRVRRILPALLTMLVVTGGASYFIMFGPAWEGIGEQIISAIFIYANIEMWQLAGNYWGPAAENAPLLHTWSLSVEEQFYLFIAPLFVATLRLSNKYQILVLITLLVSPSLFRYFELYNSMSETHVRLDCCAMGILLAYVKHYKKEVWFFLQARVIYLFVASVSLYMFFYLARYNSEWGVSDPSKLMLAFMFGIWIIWSDQTSFTPKNLFSIVIMHISTRSYAMYLLHVDALALVKRLNITDLFVFYVLALLITLILAEFLYRFIELPFMSSRSKFTLSKPRKARKATNGCYKEA